MSEREKVRGIVLLPEPSDNWLNARQQIAYRSHREKLITWLADEGKDPESLEGYAEDTYYVYANILDQFYRWVWEREDFILTPTHGNAELFLKQRIKSQENYSTSHLRNVKLALLAFFRFQDNEWDTDINISTQSKGNNPQDYLFLEERDALREAVLEYDTIPAYHCLDPEERREWKKYLARRYGKPMNEVGQEDWERINGFKYVSIIYTGLDAALRPIEVARAKTSWFDPENSVLRIPVQDSSKNENNWTVSLTAETTEYLARWIEQRNVYEKYEDTNHIWLTRHGNPYRSKSLQVLLDNLQEIAGIDRDFSWYAIRHSTGTYMTREEGLAAAQSQLRHERAETTMKYDQSPPDDRRDALDNM